MAVKVVHRTPVDVCEEHGVWLDKGELEAVVRRVHRKHRLAGYERMKWAEKEGRYSGKIMGWLLGPLAFLFD